MFMAEGRKEKGRRHLKQHKREGHSTIHADNSVGDPYFPHAICFRYYTR